MNKMFTINYLDASAIVKILLKEEYSDIIKKYFADNSNFHTTSFCFVEALGVLKREYRKKRISEEEYLNGCDYFIAMVADKRLEVEEPKLTLVDIFRKTEKLVKKYRVDLIDAFQMVTIKEGALSAMKPRLITADNKLAKSAAVEGIDVWNLNDKNN
jgi:predicted nucleic acid-binding protein